VVVAINCLLPMILKTSPLVKTRTTNVQFRGQFRQRMTTHRQQSQVTGGRERTEKDIANCSQPLASD
jgi:hypothetical protein